MLEAGSKVWFMTSEGVVHGEVTPYYSDENYVSVSHGGGQVNLIPSDQVFSGDDSGLVEQFRMFVRDHEDALPYWKSTFHGILELLEQKNERSS